MRCLILWERYFLVENDEFGGRLKVLGWLSVLVIAVLIGNICGRFANRVYKEQFFLPVFASLGVTAFNYFILALLMVLLGYRFNPISNVQVTLLPMLIYQLAFAYPVHYLTYQLDKKLSSKDTN